MPVKTPFNLADEKILKMKFREMDLSTSAESSKNYSLDDLSRMISESKREAREKKQSEKKKNYVPPGGWKKQDPDYAPPASKPDPVLKAKKMVTIDKY